MNRYDMIKSITDFNEWAFNQTAHKELIVNENYNYQYIQKEFFDRVNMVEMLDELDNQELCEMCRHNEKMIMNESVTLLLGVSALVFLYRTLRSAADAVQSGYYTQKDGGSIINAMGTALGSYCKNVSKGIDDINTTEVGSYLDSKSVKRNIDKTHKDEEDKKKKDEKDSLDQDAKGEYVIASDGSKKPYNEIKLVDMGKKINSYAPIMQMSCYSHFAFKGNTGEREIFLGNISGLIPTVLSFDGDFETAGALSQELVDELDRSYQSLKSRVKTKLIQSTSPSSPPNAIKIESIDGLAAVTTKYIIEDGKGPYKFGTMIKKMIQGAAQLRGQAVNFKDAGNNDDDFARHVFGGKEQIERFAKLLDKMDGVNAVNMINEKVRTPLRRVASALRALGAIEKSSLLVVYGYFAPSIGTRYFAKAVFKVINRYLRKNGYNKNIVGQIDDIYDNAGLVILTKPSDLPGDADNKRKRDYAKAVRVVKFFEQFDTKDKLENFIKEVETAQEEAIGDEVVGLGQFSPNTKKCIKGCNFIMQNINTMKIISKHQGTSNRLRLFGLDADVKDDFFNTRFSVNDNAAHLKDAVLDK